MVVLAVALIVSFACWLVFKRDELNMQEILMVASLVLVLSFALFLAFRRLRDVKQKLPAEDELSKDLMRRGTATSFHLSLLLWLIIMELS